MKKKEKCKRKTKKRKRSKVKTHFEWGLGGFQENKGYWSSVPRFLKSLLGVRKTTSMSIMLAEFDKFPFEHFAWGQMLLYYNRVSTVTKDRILGKTWEA